MEREPKTQKSWSYNEDTHTLTCEHTDLIKQEFKLNSLHESCVPKAIAHGVQQKVVDLLAGKDLTPAQQRDAMQERFELMKKENGWERPRTARVAKPAWQIVQEKAEARFEAGEITEAQFETAMETVEILKEAM